MRTKKITRLLEMKKHELDALRQDMARLDQLTTVAAERVRAARDVQDRYTHQIRDHESAGLFLTAVEMIERRRFLAHLTTQSEQAEESLEGVQVQKNYALQGLNTKYTEMRSLELLAERELAQKQVIDDRRAYAAADDEYTIRFVTKA
nr:hypothetical protein [Pseudomethylobacillus aquaticus]